MDTDRSMRLWRLAVAYAQGDTVGVAHVCAAAISATGVDGAAVTMMLGTTPYETISAGDRLASELAELAVTLGEGPSVSARTDGPVLAADLAAARCQARWPMFAPAAVRAGGRAVFALPMAIGAIQLGVLDLCRTRPGDLDHDQLADALVLADTASALVLDAGRPDPTDESQRQPELSGMHYAEVHQATGMVMVQLGASAAVALIRLRAYAYAHDRRLRDVAVDVVARRLRFHPDTRTATSTMVDSGE